MGREHKQVNFESKQGQDAFKYEKNNDSSRSKSLLSGPRRDLKRDLARTRLSLPIFKHRRELLDAITANPNLVVAGETGSGKTTQLPQYVLESKHLVPKGQMVAITQPRRVAAVSVARRVAQEMGVRLGNEVGYRIRFDDCTSERTRLKFATDGMLLREALSDATLSKYAMVVLDEAHERTVQTDVLMALVKRAQRLRKEAGAQTLRIVAMSATIETHRFAAYLGGCPIINVEGRTFPVRTMYLAEPEPDFIDAALLTTLQIHIDQELDGDVLVFLTGQEDIETLEELLKSRAKLLPPGSPRLLIRPLYAALPQHQQMVVFEKTPPNHRKIVLATNIAETSLTIDGIKYVIDCGLSKKRIFQARTGIDALMAVPVAQSEACQRSGRAGRQREGVCFRLYPESSFEKLSKTAVPEIRRCSLGSVVLQLKLMGIDDILNFDFLDAPPKDALVRALMHLYELDALDASGALTELGRKMALFPLDPSFAKVLIVSAEFGCSEEMATLVAMLSSDAVFVYPRQRREEADAARRTFASPYGDHLTLLNVYKAAMEAAVDSRWCNTNFISARSIRKATAIRSQLVACCERAGIAMLSCGDEVDRVRRCLVAGLFLNTAVLQQDRSYRTQADAQSVHVHPTSCVFGRKPSPACVVYTELVHTTKEYMRLVTEVEQHWLPELAPKLFAAHQHNRRISGPQAAARLNGKARGQGEAPM